MCDNVITEKEYASIMWHFLSTSAIDANTFLKVQHIHSSFFSFSVSKARLLFPDMKDYQSLIHVTKQKEQKYLVRNKTPTQEENWKNIEDISTYPFCSELQKVNDPRSPMLCV